MSIANRAFVLAQIRICIFLVAPCSFSIVATADSESSIASKRPLQVVQLKTPQAIVFGKNALCNMKFTLVIDKGFHTIVNKTEVVFEKVPYIDVNVTKYPKGHDFFVKVFGKSIEVYESEVELPILAKLTGRAVLHNENPDASKKVEGRLKFQACSEKTCLMPQELPFSIDLKSGKNADCETESNKT